MKVKLFYKLFFAFFAVALIPILVGSQIFTTTLEKHLQQSSREGTQIDLQKTAAIISKTIQHFDKTLKTTTKYLLLSKGDIQTLKWIYYLHPEIDKIVEVDIDGIVLNAIARYEFIPVGSQQTDCHPTDLKNAKINFLDWNNEPHICFKNPIVSINDGKHRGALLTKVSIQSLFETLILNKNKDHTQFIVNSSNDRVVFHSDFNLVLNNQDAAHLPTVQKLHQGEIFTNEPDDGFNGTRGLGSAVSIPGTPLYLVDEIPYQQAYALLTDYKQLITKVVWFSILFILIMAFLFSRTITKPIRRLLSATTKIEAGNLDTVIQQPNNKMTDEITDFSLHFKSMVESLKQDRIRRDAAITLERATQEKLHRAQKMETIGLLTGGAAHDLNNILSGIIGYPELILRKLPHDSPLRPSIEAIKQSGENASAIVADLLTVSRGIAAPRQLCNINAIVDDYCSSPELENLRSQYPKISCDRALDHNLLNTNCSPIHLKKSLMNLVTNAVEAIEDSGSILIKTENQLVDNDLANKIGIIPGRYTVLQVTDTGPGIPEKDLKNIFEPFYTKKEMGRSGTGLGLTIVLNTVQDHDGGILVESDNQGTSFKLFFPATAEKISSAAELTTNSPLPRGKGESILVVDDVEQQRDLAKQMLSGLGYSVETVTSGEAALTFLKKKPVDLIVLDMIMNPGIGGLETYKQIIALYPKQKAIIASGYAESLDVKKTLALGAGPFIQKPYNIATIAGAIHSALTKKHE
jgi:signal transduction histidine kinase/ActR/RegA family two-component response regulator